MSSLILKNGIIISPNDGLSCQKDIKIENGVIFQIEKNIVPTKEDTVKDCEGMIVAPGFVELHSHMREPGFETKETLETGLKAAIAGGYTALCAMANTNPIVDNVEIFRSIQEKAKSISPIDFHQVCAITKGFKEEKLTDIKTLVAQGAIAFSNDGKPIENMQLLKEAFEVVKSLDTLIMLHSEVSEFANGGCINDGVASKRLGVQGIPNEAEFKAVERELDVIRSVGDVRAHFCHISTKESVELIRKAKKEGLKVTAETAPHYFSLNDEDIKENDARFKMNPPLRSKEDQQAIIEGLIDGTIDAIATDHAPHTNVEKTSLIQTAPMGIVGLETALPLAITNLVKKGYVSLSKAIALLSSNPAKILKLNNQGCIKKGNISNLVVFTQDKKQIIKGENFKSKSKLTPFEDCELFGKVEFTVINGEIYR